MKRFGDILLESGLLTKEQLEQALDRQNRCGGRLASNCLELGLASEEVLAVLLCNQIGAPFVVLSKSIIPLESTNRLPADLAKLWNALPLWSNKQNLYMATSDPTKASVLDELRFITGTSLVEHGALAGPLKNAVEFAYAPADPSLERVLRGPLVNLAFQHEPVYLEIVTPTLKDKTLSEPPSSMKSTDAVWEQQEEAVLPKISKEKTASVLIVDDDDALRKMLVDYFRKSGYLCFEAADGRQALVQLQSNLPDAILLDAMLPGIHGFQICRRIKQAKATQYIPVVMISAVYRGGTYSDEIRLLYGASAFLEKPLKLQHLKKVLENCLSSRPVPPSFNKLSDQVTSFLEKASKSFKRGNTEEAARSLEKAVAIAPFFPTIHHRLALLYLQLNEKYRAIAQLEQMMDLQPTFQGRVLLAQTHERAGFLQKALECWQMALTECSKESESTWIQQHIQELQQR
jgi:DNA-binding response OmpR family regulator